MDKTMLQGICSLQIRYVMESEHDRNQEVNLQIRLSLIAVDCI